MPFFSIPLSGEGPITYGYNISPISGHIGISLILLIISSLINRSNFLLTISFIFLLIIIHPIQFVLFLPLLLSIYFLLKNKIKIFDYSYKRNFLIFLSSSGLIWPVFLSFGLQIYFKPVENYSYITEWISMHNFFIGYPSYVVIVGFISLIYSIKLLSDCLSTKDQKLTLIGYTISSYGIGLFIFNALFLETHILNISSLLMPMRYESIMICIFCSLLISILDSEDLVKSDFSKFVLSLHFALCFFFSIGIFGQRGFILYLAPLLLIKFLKKRNFNSRVNKFLFILF